MTAAREKAIERLAIMFQLPGRIDSAEQADKLIALTARMLTPEGGDTEGLARARWEERKADAAHVLDALSLAAIDPAQLAYIDAHPVVGGTGRGAEHSADNMWCGRDGVCLRCEAISDLGAAVIAQLRGGR
jgi:hypothetical protein